MSITSTILQQMPDTAQDNNPAYYSDSTVVFKPKRVFAHDTVFNTYHFVIPSSPFFPHLKIEKKTYQPVHNRVLPVNPGQMLSCSESREVKEYIAFFIDKQLMDDMSYQICKKTDVNFINKSYVPSNHGLSLIRQFIDEFTNKQLGYEFILQSLSMQLAVTLIREFESNISKVSARPGFTDKANINRAIVFLKECYNSNFTLEDIAKVANLSPYHFIRVFKAETGKTPFEYLMDIKIEKSRELLKLEGYSITDIGFLCGFTSASHFSAAFSKKIGVSPSQYRQIVL